MECHLDNVQNGKSRHRLAFHFPRKPEHPVVGDSTKARMDRERERERENPTLCYSEQTGTCNSI